MGKVSKTNYNTNHMTTTKTTTSYWKEWWNDYAKKCSKDEQADRGFGARIEAFEKMAAERFLKEVEPKPTDRLLDAGCGTGVNCSKFNGLVAEIVAMDFSEEMIRRAERRVARESIKGVNFVQGNITKMNFPDSSFDKIICASVLQYLNDDECEAAFREMVRVGRDGGIMVIHAKNRNSLYGLSLGIFRAVGRAVGKRTTPGYFRPRAWYEQAINRAGGEILNYDSFGKFTLVGLPNWLVRFLLHIELKLIHVRLLKGLGVNYRLKVRIVKSGQAASRHKRAL